MITKHKLTFVSNVSCMKCPVRWHSGFLTPDCALKPAELSNGLDSVLDVTMSQKSRCDSCLIKDASVNNSWAYNLYALEFRATSQGSVYASKEW